MPEKTVTDMIFEKFAQRILTDKLFTDISDELVALMQARAKDNVQEELI